MRVASLLPILMISLVGALPAAATGTLDCVADANGTQIDVHGVVPYSSAAPLIQVEAEISATLPGVGKDLGRVAFGSEHNAQYWLDGETLNVLFYREREGEGPFGSTMLAIKTMHSDADEEGSYAGTYDIEGYEVPANGGESVVVHATGAIECFAG
jgi:hypothetical protein